MAISVDGFKPLPAPRFSSTDFLPTMSDATPRKDSRLLFRSKRVHVAALLLRTLMAVIIMIGIFIAVRNNAELCKTINWRAKENERVADLNGEEP